MIYVPEQNKVVISTNVDFLVTQFPGAAHRSRDSEPYSYTMDIDHEIPVGVGGDVDVTVGSGGGDEPDAVGGSFGGFAIQPYGCSPKFFRTFEG